LEPYKDVGVAPLIMPEETNMPPPLPHISETAFGQASTKFVKEAVLPNIKNIGREAILELRQELDNALTTNKELKFREFSFCRLSIKIVRLSIEIVRL
jgi:hypothetical protein